MTNEKARQTLGKLIEDGRLRLGLGQQPFATLADIAYGTLRSVESGVRVPRDTNRRKLEDTLRWRQGSIKELIEQCDESNADSFTLEYMGEGVGERTWQDLDVEETGLAAPISRASLLSNEELIGELALRLYNNRTAPYAADQNEQHDVIRPDRDV